MGRARIILAAALLAGCGLKVAGSFLGDEDGGPGAATPDDVGGPTGGREGGPSGDSGAPGDANVDGDASPFPVPCGDQCRTAGGACDGTGGCRFTCGTCGPVHCPPGIPCAVTCQSGGSCGAVDCGEATSCSVYCHDGNACGDVTCTGGVDAGGPVQIGTCDITCVGGSSCGHVVANGGSSSVFCQDGMACKGVVCGGGSCNLICNTATSCGLLTCCAGSCAGTDRKDRCGP